MAGAFVRIGRENNFLRITEREKAGPQPHDFGKYLIEAQNGDFSGRATCYLNSNDFEACGVR